MHDGLNLRDAAEMLGVRPRTLARWADAGALPAVRLPSGRLRFRREDLILVLLPAFSEGKRVAGEPRRRRGSG